MGGSGTAANPSEVRREERQCATSEVNDAADSARWGRGGALGVENRRWRMGAQTQLRRGSDDHL